MGHIYQGKLLSHVAFTVHSRIYTQNLIPSKAKLVRAFCTKPFPLFNAIGDLIDGSQATGEGTFQAGTTSAFDHYDSPTCDASPSSFDSKIDPILLAESRNMEKGLTQVSTF